jgi:hypothetical protein
LSPNKIHPPTSRFAGQALPFSLREGAKNDTTMDTPSLRLKGRRWRKGLEGSGDGIKIKVYTKAEKNK